MAHGPILFTLTESILIQNDVITAESDYGIKVPAVVEHGNFFGTQFHPEKSSSVGKIMLENFLKECKK